jgi:hypothetical protein
MKGEERRWVLTLHRSERSRTVVAGRRLAQARVVGSPRGVQKAEGSEQSQEQVEEAEVHEQAETADGRQSTAPEVRVLHEEEACERARACNHF